jgi:hypothetical protein
MSLFGRKTAMPKPTPKPKRTTSDTGPGTHVHSCKCGKAWPGSSPTHGDTGPR